MDETVTSGDGYTVATLDSLGSGPGFRKIRAEMGVEAFGVNAVVMPAGYEANFHAHEQQEELYFIHRGTAEIEFGDGTVHRLGPGGLARVDAATPRRLRAVGDEDVIYLCAGGKGGYVGRDGVAIDPGAPRVQRTGS
jgi:mannose-6-phosphate isomerase-like protein (cupin superfamily)